LSGISLYKSVFLTEASLERSQCAGDFRLSFCKFHYNLADLCVAVIGTGVALLETTTYAGKRRPCSPLRSFRMNEFESCLSATTITMSFVCFCVLYELQVPGSDESELVPAVRCN
jgi:hypothetical protein